MENMISKKVLYLLLLPALGCTTPYKKTLLLTSAGVAVGALYGMTRPQRQIQNATTWGSLGGLAGAATGLVLNIDEADPEKLKIENESLKKKLNEFEKAHAPQLLQSGNSLFNSPLPKEVSALIEPGEWKRYKLDQWVQDPNQANTWYRQVEMFEIIPPVSK